MTTAGTIHLTLVEPFVPKVQAKGSLIFQSEIIGSLRQPSLSAQVELREGEVTSPDIPVNIRDIVLLAKIDENLVNLERFSAGIGDGNISAHGKFSLASLVSAEKAGENDIVLTVKNLNLGYLNRLVPIETTAELGGFLEGIVRIQGNFRDLSQLEIEGELSRLLLSLSRFELENAGKIKFSLQNSVFHLHELRLSGGDSSIFAAGNLDLSKEIEMDVRFSANLDSAVLTPFFKSVSSGGTILLDLNLKGSPSSLAIIGEGEVKDGFFEVKDLPMIATNIEGKIQFSESSLSLSSLQGILNGGMVKIQGKLDYHGFSVKSLRAEIMAEGVQMNYPPGLQAQANGTLFLEGKGDQWRLSGDMKVAQAYYSMNIYPGAELVSNIRFRRVGIKSEKPVFLQNLNLDVGLFSLDSIVIKNNLASLELKANIRILGTLDAPQLSGRVVNRYVGEIIFADRTFDVEQASLDFLGTDPLEGQLHLVAHTYLTHNYDDLEITLTLSGPISKLNYSLSSFPPRPQGELASLLITGYGIEKLKSETANIVGNQMVLYFASPLASPVAEKIKNILRAEEVSIEPINIATEEDPGARFTFRRGLVKNVDLVYSIDVSNTQHHTWILEYDLSRNFSIHSFRKDDGSYGSMLSHRFFLDPFIPKSQALYETQRRYIIKEVQLEGNLAFPQPLLKKKIRPLKKGTVFNHGELRKSIDKLMAFYKENNYLNVVVNPGISYEDNKSAIISLNISAQKPAVIVYAGDPVSPKTKNEVVGSWNGRLPEVMALEEAKSRILNGLKGKGFYEAEVKIKKSVTEEQSFYAFSVSRGPSYRIQTFALEGQSSIAADTIKKAISKIPRPKGKGLWALVYDFRRARVRIRDLYTEKGYLNPVISPPQVQVDRNQKIIHITLPVEQGPQSRIHSLEIKGNRIFRAEELKKGLRSAEKAIYRPSLLSEDRNHLFNFYKSKGYQEVTVGVEIVSEPEGPEVNLIFTINEGELHTIAEIDISGNIRTPDYVIQRELLFREGDPVNMEKLMLSQKKLYDLSIFKSVNIRRQPLESLTGQEKILVEVQEDSMFALSYGLRYSSEEKFEVFGQLDSVNIFGRGRNGLIYYKWNERQKNFRFSLKEPYLFGKRFNTLHSFYYLEETLATFKTEEIGYTIQQELQLPFDFSLSYLYRLRRIHEYELESFGPFVFDITLFLSELQTYVVRDTRNNKLNARQGSFFSLSLTYSPEFLGSDLTYLSLFCQYSLYKALGSRIIWASNYRIGLADAFEQVLIPSKRFYAGGGNSIRGFKRDLVGPYDPFLQRPEGGEAVFIMNQELRFPVYKWLEGVVFYDIGNVYENLGDFNPFDVRQSLGLGLRLNTPMALIRVDYGINLLPRRDEPKGVLFFSVGQSF
jgi:outer membrane protein assembly complex protein YaeT